MLKTRFTFTGLFALCYFSTSYSQVVNGVNYSDRANVYKTFDMTGTDIFGQRFASENLTITDPVTGVKYIALTTSRHTNSKIYQDHPNWTSDGKYIIFHSNRNASRENSTATAGPPRGGNHYYAVSMDNYEIVQVTSGRGGGDLLVGHTKNTAYRISGDKVIEFRLGEMLSDNEAGKVKDSASYHQVIASLPDTLRAGGTCLDAKDNRIFFSSRIGENSAIYCVDFQSGKTTKLVEVPFRTGHFQANPWVSGEIMYCWETGGDAPQRIWILSVDNNGKVVNRPVYKERADEWVTHEIFNGPDNILFNVMGHLDRLRKNPTGIMSLNIRTNQPRLLGQAKENGGYWHAAGTKDLKWAVGDTFNGNIYRLDLENGTARLLTTGHRIMSQSPFSSEAHAHQSISPDGKWILFNSSLLNISNIMMVPLHP